MMAAVLMINDMIMYDNPASNTLIADDEMIPFVIFVIVAGTLNQFSLLQNCDFGVLPTNNSISDH